MLYQLTGEKKYADLGRQCVELAFRGQRDRDDRYSFRAPGGQLRAGPTLGMYALAYDLCYDGWDQGFRREVALALQNWKDEQSGEWAKTEQNSLQTICLTPHQMPACNHWGSQLGAGLVVLALLGDPGTDDALLRSCLAAVEKNMVRSVTAGFGDGGFFAEGPGPAHMMANPGLVPLVQAFRVAQGRDYVTPRPNFSWMTLHWVMEVLPDAKGEPVYPCRKPSNYGGERMLDGNGGFSHGGWFSQGFGAIPAETKPALLWTYNHFAAETDAHRRDTLNYPHRAIFALVNWPIGIGRTKPGGNPRPHQRRPRPRLVSVPQSMARCRRRGRQSVAGQRPARQHQRRRPRSAGLGHGRAGAAGDLAALPDDLLPREKDGSGVVSGGGYSVAVDFGGRSGAPVLVAIASESDLGKSSRREGADAAQITDLKAGKTNFRVLTMTHGKAPEPKISGDTVQIGKRKVLFDGKNLKLQ